MSEGEFLQKTLKKMLNLAKCSGNTDALCSKLNTTDVRHANSEIVEAGGRPRSLLHPVSIRNPCGAARYRQVSITNSIIGEARTALSPVSLASNSIPSVRSYGPRVALSREGKLLI
jgi:hypothetical protein